MRTCLYPDDGSFGGVMSSMVCGCCGGIPALELRKLYRSDRALHSGSAKISDCACFCNLSRMPVVGFMSLDVDENDARRAVWRVAAR